MSEIKAQSIGVQFSGKSQVYFYVIHPDDTIQPGMRVVVPNRKLKDDGKLSMSIATCVERHDERHAEAKLPIIQTLWDENVNYAVEQIKKLDAAEAAGEKA